MQLGLVLDGFTWDEMLFDVAQGGSWNSETTTGPPAQERTRVRVVQVHDKQKREESAGDYW